MSENAKEYFASGYNCAQSVFRAVLEAKGLFFDEASFLAAGFGGGVGGQQGDICGAVAGAIMAIGILHKQSITDIVEHKKATYKSANVFVIEFQKIHKTHICNDLVGFDMSDNEAKNKAREEGVFTTICPKFVETAVEIVLDMYND